MNMHFVISSDRELSARVFQIVAALLQQNQAVTHSYVLDILKRIRRGKERLGIYDRLPQTIDPNRVNSSYPAGSPFELWLDASGLDRKNPTNSVSDQEAKDFAFQAINPADPIEVGIINDEWQSWIAASNGRSYTSDFELEVSV